MRFSPDSIVAARKKIAFIQRRAFASFYDDNRVSRSFVNPAYSFFTAHPFATSCLRFLPLPLLPKQDIPEFGQSARSADFNTRDLSLLLSFFSSREF